jgi:hypothetical protein
MRTLQSAAFGRRLHAFLFVLVAPLALAHCGGGVLGDDCKSDSDCDQSLSCRTIGDATALECTASCHSDADCEGLPTPTIGASYTATCAITPEGGFCMASQGPL